MRAATIWPAVSDRFFQGECLNMLPRSTLQLWASPDHCIVDQKPFGASWEKFEKRLAQRKADDNPIDRERRRGGGPCNGRLLHRSPLQKAGRMRRRGQQEPQATRISMALSHSSHGDPTGLSGHWQQRVPKWVTHPVAPSWLQGGWLPPSSCRSKQTNCLIRSRRPPTLTSSPSIARPPNDPTSHPHLVD